MHTLLGEETNFLEEWFRNTLLRGSSRSFLSLCDTKKETGFWEKVLHHFSYQDEF